MGAIAYVQQSFATPQAQYPEGSAQWFAARANAPLGGLPGFEQPTALIDSTSADANVLVQTFALAAGESQFIPNAGNFLYLDHASSIGCIQVDIAASANSNISTSTTLNLYPGQSVYTRFKGITIRAPGNAFGSLVIGNRVAVTNNPGAVQGVTSAYVPFAGAGGGNQNYIQRIVNFGNTILDNIINFPTEFVGARAIGVRSATIMVNEFAASSGDATPINLLARLRDPLAIPETCLSGWKARSTGLSVGTTNTVRYSAFELATSMAIVVRGSNVASLGLEVQQTFGLGTVRASGWADMVALF
jgi:hypothetical protein